MSKSRSFFGLRRGSTKNFTFSVDNGKQVTKERADFVKNPRTPQQMENRLLMATTTAAYSGLKEIVDHSFEGVQYGRDSMAEFIRRNYAMLRQDAQSDTPAGAYNPYRDRHVYPNKFIISKGSLTPVPTSAYRMYWDEGIGLDLNLGAKTADGLLTLLGCNVGDIVTFVCLVGVDSGEYQPYSRFEFVRVKFLQGGTTDISAVNYTDYLELETSLPLLSNPIMIEENRLVILLDLPSGVYGGLYSAAIKSVEGANGWLRSDAAFKQEMAYAVQSTFADALATYPKGKAYLLNGAPL